MKIAMFFTVLTGLHACGDAEEEASAVETSVAEVQPTEELTQGGEEDWNQAGDQGGDQGGYPQGGNPQGGNQGEYQGGNPQGGNPQGGDQGGYAQGGNPQGGNPQGGDQGGYAQGGNQQGGNGNPQGGNQQGEYQGGNPQGGNGNPQGGNQQGGNPQGGNHQGGNGNQQGGNQGREILPYVWCLPASVLETTLVSLQNQMDFGAYKVAINSYFTQVSPRSFKTCDHDLSQVHGSLRPNERNLLLGGVDKCRTECQAEEMPMSVGQASLSCYKDGNSDRVDAYYTPWTNLYKTGRRCEGDWVHELVYHYVCSNQPQERNAVAETCRQQVRMGEQPAAGLCSCEGTQKHRAFECQTQNQNIYYVNPGKEINYFLDLCDHERRQN